MNDNFDFNWKSFKDATIILAVAYVLMCLFSCRTHRSIETISTDSVSKAHIEQTNVWYDVSKIDTIIHDRIITIMLNANGDTVKEKEYVYVREVAEANTQSVINSEKIDSAKHEATYVRTEVKEKELTAWQKFKLNTYWYLVFIVGIVIFFALIKFRVIR